MKNIKRRTIRTPNPAQAVINKEQILDCLIEEISGFHEGMHCLTSMEIYPRAYEIYLVEEMVYLLEHLWNDLDNGIILAVLNQLTADGKFLSTFLGWALSKDSVNVTSPDETFLTLRYFCEEWLRNKK